MVVGVKVHLTEGSRVIPKDFITYLRWSYISEGKSFSFFNFNLTATKTKTKFSWHFSESGPHHGHYVTLVKSHDTWVLFDDDCVEVIKESDIPKYFGDASFTVEGAINPPLAPQINSSAAVTILKNAGMSVTGTSGTSGLGAAAGGAGGMIAPGPPSGATANAQGQKQEPVQGSGYVLFYQAAGIDWKALGLSSPAGVSGLKEAKEVKEMVGRELAARNVAGNPGTVTEVKINGPEPTTTTTATVAKPIPIANTSTSAFTPVVYTDEPETAESLGIPDTSPSVNPHAMPQASPSLSSSFSSTSAAIPPLALSPVSPVNGTHKVPRHALSLDIGATVNGNGASIYGDTLSPHAALNEPTPTATTHHHTGAGAFFRSLKHSTSVRVGDKGGLSASSPALAVGSGEKVKEKSKGEEKEKEKGGWFSTARKSVKRKDKGKKETILPPPLPTNEDVIIIGPETTANAYGNWEPGTAEDTSNGLSVGAGNTPSRRPSAPAALESAFTPISAVAMNGCVEMVMEEDETGGSVPPSSASSSSPRLPLNSLPHDQLSIPNSANGSSPRLTLPRMSTSSTVLHVPPSTSPSSRSPPMTAPLTATPRPRSAGGRGHTPRKSMTLYDPPQSAWLTSPPVPPVPQVPAFSGPIPRPSKERDRVEELSDGAAGKANATKRSSRKMSLSGGTLRLSGFGWHSKDKSEKDHRN
ncbi:hypothetical protein FRC03_009941 [Tulasnella sp. 419]|nr:hypothetical protein FRC03_009941 [Tulasnella sp. 419]